MAVRVWRLLMVTGKNSAENQLKMLSGEGSMPLDPAAAAAACLPAGAWRPTLSHACSEATVNRDRCDRCDRCDPAGSPCRPHARHETCMMQLAGSSLRKQPPKATAVESCAYGVHSDTAAAYSTAFNTRRRQRSSSCASRPYRQYSRRASASEGASLPARATRLLLHTVWTIILW
jgi:hypothetical protein